MWLAVALLSLLGLSYPIAMLPILVFQLFYKGLWILVVWPHAMMTGKAYSKLMFLVFAVYVIVLPHIIPWTKFVI